MGRVPLELRALASMSFLAATLSKVRTERTRGFLQHVRPVVPV
jgi:hypothetical protein